MGTIFDGFDRWTDPDIRQPFGLRQNTVIAVDTNVLLWLYKGSPSVRSDFLKVLRAVADDGNLFVPQEVMREFWKGRMGRIAEAYDEKDKSRGSAMAGAKKLKEAIEVWWQRITGDERLPADAKAALSTEERSHVERECLTLAVEVDEVLRNVEAYIQSTTEELIGFPKHVSADQDPVVLALADILGGAVGPAPSDDERRRHYTAAKQTDRSPGVTDREHITESDIGDYLVWQQLLDHMSSREGSGEGPDLVFVTREKKLDWWRTDHYFKSPGNRPKDTAGVLVGAHPDLIEDYRSRVGGQVYVWSHERLLEFARDSLDVKVSEQTEREVAKTDLHTVEPSAATEIEVSASVDSGRTVKGLFDFETNELTIVAGSAVRDRMNESLAETYRMKRAELITDGVIVGEGDSMEFAVDYVFGAPSAAAAVAGGYMVNGNTFWRDADGLTLGERKKGLQELVE